MCSVLAQEQAGLLPWGTAASATGSSLHGVSAASLARHLGRAQRNHPQGSMFSSGTSSTCWGWPSIRTQLCLNLSVRTATPSSTSATASSSPSCRESTCPRWAPGSPVHSRRSVLYSFGGAQAKPPVCSTVLFSAQGVPGGNLCSGEAMVWVQQMCGSPSTTVVGGEGLNGSGWKETAMKGQGQPECGRGPVKGISLPPARWGTPLMPC